MEVIKCELANATASPKTVEGLGHLLGLNRPSTAPRATTGTTSRATITNTRTARNGTVTVSKATTASTRVVQKDASPALSERDRYALATETVNICLKQLTDLLKSHQGDQTTSKANDKTASKDHGTRTKRPLQPRSGNSTPLPCPHKASESREKPRPEANTELEKVSCGRIRAVAECAHLSFTFLRSANTTTLKVQERPRFQLENGQLAFVSKLIGLGLYEFAATELRIVQTSLEQTTERPTHDNKDSHTRAASLRFERLLNLRCTSEKPLDDETIPVAISYYQQALKLISASARPGDWEGIYRAISQDDQDHGYISIVHHAAKISGDVSKAKKQLDALSAILFNACPGLASTADMSAPRQDEFPPPEVALRLQVLALCIRHKAMKLTGGDARLRQPLLGPVYKCMTAFARRSRVGSEVQCDVLEECFEEVSSLGEELNGNDHFKIHQLLATVNGSAGKLDRAVHWATQMHHDCRGLGPQHARCVASIIAQATPLVQMTNANVMEYLSNASKRLAEPLSGNGEDYEILLTSLAGLLRVLPQSSTEDSGLPPLAAGFAQRYARSYPGKNTQHVRDIISNVVSRSKSNDELMSWLNIDAVSAFVHGGTLKEVVESSRTVPLSVAWTISTASARLATVLKTLILGAVRSFDNSKKVSVCDDENACLLERGVMLELQLRFMLDIAPKRKYHAGLTLLLKDMLRRLGEIYTTAEYPVRRARVACMVFAIRECRVDLIPPHIFKVWQETCFTDECDLGEDSGLEVFRHDIAARLSVWRLFSEGRLSSESLKSALASYQRLLDDRTSPSSSLLAFDEPEIFIQQLRSIVAYFVMLGEDSAAIRAQAMIVQTLRIQQKEPRLIAEAFAVLARIYLRLGHPTQAETYLTSADVLLAPDKDLGIEHVEYCLARVDFSLATGKLEESGATLDRCSELCDDTIAKAMPQGDRVRYQRLRSEAWLLQSQHCLQTGLPHDALAAAKNAVKALNTFWQIMERGDSGPKKEIRATSSDADDSNVAELTKGVSKLNLMPNHGDDEQNRTTKGAKFWPFMPVLCRALLQLSDMYAHHGRYSEARCLSDQAMSIAQSVNSTIWLSRIRSHRCCLLLLAGQLDAAELSMAQTEISADTSPCLPSVERLRAKAALSAASGEVEAAVEMYDESVRILNDLQSSAYISGAVTNLMKRADGNVEDASNGCSVKPGLELVTDVPAVRLKGRSTASNATKKSGSKTATSKPRQAARQPNTDLTKAPLPCAIPELVAAEAFFERTLLSQSLDHDLFPVLQRLLDQRVSRGILSETAGLQYSSHLRTAVAKLEQDVTLNILAESTLATPAIVGLSKQRDTGSAPSQNRTTTKKAALKARSKATTAETSSIEQDDEGSLVALFGAAHDCLATEQPLRMRVCSTSQTHSDCSKLSSVSALRYALSAPAAHPATEVIYQAYLMESARVKALEYEERAVLADRKEGSALTWPVQVRPESNETMTPELFQADYVDIIPASWTAVSLCLSEDCKDFFIARYRSGHQPIVLKQPFSRHKPDGIEDEAFDFARGRTELQEIIDLCNYTAHNHGDLKSKGGSTKWWNQRKALDKRLHELLINIESIWFGGFKSVFSRHIAQRDGLLQFRQSFDSILGKYLLSRKSTKGRSDGLQLDDKILELFVGLDCGDDSESMDDSLADLLYFVVDLLQFNGERNAYDEIDFDSMAIEVQDALRVYEDSTSTYEQPDQHLVLVLDRRLQAFPWESMPCLQDASVSRVGSMLSLRQGILAMRKAIRSTAADPGSTVDDRYAMRRTSGTFILNPSSNLPATQTKLLPSLSTLGNAQGASWTSIVGEAPTEAAYSSALTKSSMFLYFGHGSGSQYIRPRTIKQLDRCSEVVWLMGCSSSKISEHGQLEASAVPLAHMLAGGKTIRSEEGQDENTRCLTVVGCLWDVTDKDIDRFSLALGEEWGLWPAVEREKFPKVPPARHEKLEAPSTPDQVRKTPKTPKVRKMLPEFQTPARRETPASGETGKCSLVEAVNRSREACYLRYLNGAAPVVYGIPVYLAD